MMLYRLYGWIGKLIKPLEDAVWRPNPARARVLPGHTLYHFQVSPFSHRARIAVRRLGLELPFKDVLLDETAWKEMMDGGGKDQVPCLRIDGPQGTRWLYESRDIVAYLESQAR